MVSDKIQEIFAKKKPYNINITPRLIFVDNECMEILEDTL